MDIVLKRLYKEYYDSLKSKYENCVITIGYKEEEQYNPKYTGYKLELNVDNKKLLFKFPVGYPFKAPSLYVDGINYNKMVCMNHPFYKSELLKENPLAKCLCYLSFSCGDNWSPAITIETIIEQFRENKAFITKTMYKRHLKIILEAKNIHALELYDKICHYL